MTKLYGTSRSRSARSLWALEELGVKYEHLPIATTEAKSAENLKRNPNGHVPVLEDDGIVVWESMAINLYLAEKYGKNSLWPPEPAAHADIYKWSFWALTEVEPHLMTLLRARGIAQGQGISARQELYDRALERGRGHELGADDEARLVIDSARTGVVAKMPWAGSQ